MSATTSQGNAFLVWWNPQSLAVKFSMGFGALIFLVILAALIKLTYDKCTLKGHIKREKAEAAQRKADEAFQEEVAKKRLSSMEEGELFGVRAIQSGYFGGVAQSAPNSPNGSRAGSLYNQPVSPSGPLNNSSQHLPLMHPQASSPLASSTSLPLVRSPLGQNSAAGDSSYFSPTPGSPISSLQLSNSPRLGASTPRLIPLSPLIHQQQHDNDVPGITNIPLKPSASDASDTTKATSKADGTSHGSRSRGSSFTSTYSFEEGMEQQPQKPTILQALPTLPVLQPLSAEITDGDSRGPSPTKSTTVVAAELPANRVTSPRDTNFSTPFRRPSQPETPRQSVGLGLLPAAAMNGGPQQFGPARTQSPASMQGKPQMNASDRSQSPARMYSVPPNRVASPGPGMQPMRSASPGARGPPSRQGTFPPSQGLRRQPPAPLNFPSKQPSLPSFLQADSGPKTAPLHNTTSRTLMPEKPKQNRLTAELLGEFYDSYQYQRNSGGEQGFEARRAQAQGQGFELASMSAPGTPRMGRGQGPQQQQQPLERRLV